MIGAIIGDIVGSRFEFNNNTTDRNFKLFTKESSFTDDTICTVAIADALLSGRSYEYNTRAWCYKYPHPMGGYGGSFASWLRSEHPEPYDSFGNGAAMRVSPVGWWFQDLDTVLQQARETAAFSHNHPEGIKGAQAIAYAIWILRRTKDLNTFINCMETIYPGFQRDYPVGVFDETCQGTVPVACKIICEASSFEDAIRRAILQGGDSDTLGAITGSMAEALWDIPEELCTLALNYLPDEMFAVVEQFYNSLQNSERY